jgi:hypothetical protein
MPCKKCENDKTYKWGNTGECKYATKDECEKANPKNYKEMKNTPTPLGKKTYEEYEKELKEFNLSKVEKVELGAIDDAEKISKKLKSELNSGNSQEELLKETMKNFSDIEKTLSKAKISAENAKKLLSDRERFLTNTQISIEKNQVDLQDKIVKIRVAMKELGVSTNDLPFIKDAENNLALAEKALRQFDKTTANARKLKNREL